MRVPTADELSIVPGIQQVVGAATVLSNVAKVIGNLAQIAFYGMSLGLANRSNKDSSKIKVTESRDNLKKTKRSLDRHARFIIVGLVRATPIIGSLCSYAATKSG